MAFSLKKYIFTKNDAVFCIMWCLLSEFFEVLDLRRQRGQNTGVNIFFGKNNFFSSNDAVILHPVCLKNATS